MRIAFRLIVISAVFALVSCSKNIGANPIYNSDITSMDELVAPPEFAYEMLRTYSIKSLPKGNPYLGKAKVKYYGISDTRRDLLMETMQVVNDTTIVNFPAAEIYTSIGAEVYFPDGSSAFGVWNSAHPDKVLIAEVIRGQLDPITNVTYKSSGFDCQSCATVVDSIPSSLLVVPADSTVCLTGGLSGKGILIKAGGTLRLCGQFVSVLGIQLNEGAQLEINERSSLELKTGNELMLGPNARLILHNDSRINLARELTVADGASIINYGSIYADSHFNAHRGGTIVNYGTIGVKGHIEAVGSTARIDNLGLMYNVANDHIRATDTAKINNFCHIHSDQHIWIEEYATLNNHNQIDCDHRLKMNGFGELNMYSGSIAVSQDLQLYEASINGIGPLRAVIKVTDDAIYFDGATATGLIDFCIGDMNQNAENLSFASTAQYSCSNAIPTSMCITIGHNPTLDSDQDNVADILDPFPADSTRCGTICRGASTLIFEDNWPYQGDYDFNDLVLSYQLWGIINSNGDLKDIYFAYKLRAKGASYKNGFGIELNTDPSNVNTPVVEGENGLTSTSIVLGNISDILQSWNTDSTAISNPVDVPWDTVVFTFSIPVADSVIDSFNPFLFVDQDRGREVHLANHRGTPRVDASFYGVGDDASEPLEGRYYTTANNQPWAMSIPIIFDYPLEGEDLSQTYNYFADWASSGGTNSKDWYDSSKSGNAKSQKLFK